MGPDEYHEVVDDNAFTNVMARWNLRRGAQLVEAGGRHDRSRRVAAPRRRPRRRVGSGSAPVSSSSPATGISNRCSPQQSPTPPIAADVLLGADRVEGLAAHQASRRPHAAPSHPGRRATRFARRQPRLLRTAHGARQLVVTRDPRLPARPGGPARAGARVVPSGRSARPRRPHRHDRRRPASGHDGRGLAGPRLRVPRVTPRRGRARNRSVPSPIVDGARAPLAVPRPSDRRARRPRLDHRQLCRSRGGAHRRRAPVGAVRLLGGRSCRKASSHENGPRCTRFEPGGAARAGDRRGVRSVDRSSTSKRSMSSTAGATSPSGSRFGLSYPSACSPGRSSRPSSAPSRTTR